MEWKIKLNIMIRILIISLILTSCTIDDNYKKENDCDCFQVIQKTINKDYYIIKRNCNNEFETYLSPNRIEVGQYYCN